VDGSARLPDNYLAKVELDLNFNEGLILAQDERWRRALRMQVERTFGLVADG
jgi:hypothetical protein